MGASKGQREDAVAILLLVEDHEAHDVGSRGLDVKTRVRWAWEAARKSGVKLRFLSVNVSENTLNGKHGLQLQSEVGPILVELLRRSRMAAGRLLPRLAKTWAKDAPKTMRGNIEAKLGSYGQVMQKRMHLVEGPRAGGVKDTNMVQSACSLWMKDAGSAGRAAEAMLVAAVFATDLSVKAGVPVLVLGRPPGHHATCGHDLRLGDTWRAPCGQLPGASLGGGCFYPSVWLAALHSLRKGHAKRLAYVDIDAHMPDGVWKEVDHFSKLKKDQRDFLIGKRNSCTGILFSSIHIDGYPNQGSSWHSVKQNLKRSFEVRVRDTLLPRSVTQGTASSANQGLITRYQRWCNTLDKEMTSFQPDGLFVGLGFDLHQKEAQISDKKVGRGICRVHYEAFFANFSRLPEKAPMVLMLEGGYTKQGVEDGILGTLQGLKVLAQRKGTKKRQQSQPNNHKAQKKRRTA